MAWAKAQPKSNGQPINRNSLLKQIAFMEATLPSKNVDEDAGKERTAVFVKLLGHATGDAIVWMVAQACARFAWFPTPRQCLDLLKEHDRLKPPTEAQNALEDGRKFLERFMSEWMDRLKSGDASALKVDGIPERWKWIALERGYLRRTDDERFELRIVKRDDDLFSD